jgi:hypothetical protein
MLVIAIAQLLTVFHIIARADAALWELLEGADFSFSQLRDGGDRETKPVVLRNLESFGVPLGPADQFGLLIDIAPRTALDPIAKRLQTAISQDTAELTLVRSILTDTDSRHHVIATTENDYTHALHGMFMVGVNNLIAKSETFENLVEEYGTALGYTATVRPALAAQRSVQTPYGWFFPDWLVAYPRLRETHAAQNPREVLSTVEFKVSSIARPHHRDARW